MTPTNHSAAMFHAQWLSCWWLNMLPINDSSRGSPGTETKYLLSIRQHGGTRQANMTSVLTTISPMSVAAAGGMSGQRRSDLSGN